MATTNALNNKSAPFTVTSGNLAVSAGNITLPTANSGLTNGVISWATSNLRIHDFGTDNIFIGAGAGNGTLTATDNVFVGANGGSALTNGVGNMGIGANCLSAVSSGGSNVGMGIATLHTISTNSACTGVGHNSLNLCTGSSNTAIGYQSLNQLASGTNNVAIGYQAGTNYTGSETNNLCLGFQVTGTAAESNVIRIGNSSHTSAFITGVASVAVSNLNVVTINTSTGQLGSQAASSGGLTWSVITADQNITVANGYICNKAGLLTLTLPASASVGDTFEVTGINTDLGWKVGQNANQQIFYGNQSTTVGTSGSLASTLKRDSIRVVCVVAGSSTVYNVVSSVGNITVV